MKGSVISVAGVIALSVIVLVFQPGIASAEREKKSGDIAAGLFLDGGNGGIAPFALYHLTDDFVLRGWLPVSGNYTGFGASAIYHFKHFALEDKPGSLYGGVGYTVLDGPEYFGAKVSGSGVLFSGGSQFNFTDHISAAAEVIYSLATFEVDSTFGGHYESDYADISFLLAIGYYF